MRKIDWEKALSAEDIAFLRQAGIPGMMERVEAHQAQFDAKVPEVETLDDPATRSALDAQGRVADPVEGVGVVTLIDPLDSGDAPDDDEDDEDLPDYDKWPVKELTDEVDARNAMENTTNVEVVGTGKDGAVRKPDLVKGLRLWDQENPDALKD